MAYRKSKGKMTRRSKKIEPAVMTITLSTPSVTAGSTESFYCDLSQMASLVNRRFYRQGISWAVAGVKILTSIDGSITTRKLPATWTMSNSWEKGFRTWQKMNDDALEETASVKPRFLDYKIYADARHHNKGYAANLLPVTYTVDAAGVITATTATPGEWIPSKMVIPDTTLGATGGVQEREIIAVGGNYPGNGFSGLNAVSLIEGYAASRGLPAISDPNTPDDANDADGVSPENWLQATFNEGTQQDADVLDTMAGVTAENNIAPYPFENDGTATDTMYPGGANQLNGMEIHDISYITPSTIGGITRIKGGMFPCGLMAFDWAPGSVSGNIAIQIDLVPGHHRGYLCELMTEM